MNNNIGLLLSKRAFLNPDREAYVDATHRLTFDALNRRSNCTGNALVAMGVEPGDRVALLLMNSTDFMESYFALAKIGAVVVPLNWRLVADELEFILKDSGAQTLIYGKEFVDLVAELHSRGERTEVSHWLQAGNGSSSHFALDYQQQKQGARISGSESLAPCFCCW